MPVLTKINTNVIADNAVTAAKIPTDAIGATDIAAGAVGTSELAASAVTPAKIAYLGDGSGNLSGTITNQQLHFGTTFTLTDDLTINGDVTLGKVRDDGTGQSITGDGKTLSGTGTLTMGSSFEGEPKQGRTTRLGDITTGDITAPSLVLTPGTAPATTEGAMYYDSTNDVVKFRSASAWVDMKPLYSTKGTGGRIISYDDGSTTYVAHIFTKTGTFTLSTSTNVDYLIVGGGGASGFGSTYHYGEGGGGGGGIRTLTSQAWTTSHSPLTITVGAGGTTAATGGAATDSSIAGGGGFSTLTAGAGGNGESGSSNEGYGGNGGASGGGTAASSNGGSGGVTGSGESGGGGAGYQSGGGNHVLSDRGGEGAEGHFNDIGGGAAPNCFGGGGGGGGASNTHGGWPYLRSGFTTFGGGMGKGKNFGGRLSRLDHGDVNTGGGGGGGGNNTIGGNGGSGIVIIRYTI